MTWMYVSAASWLIPLLRVFYLSNFYCMQEEDLLALLRDEETEEDKRIQTDISDEDLEKIMDRTDLIVGSDTASISEMKGPGWEVVVPTSTGGVLATLNS